MILTYYKYLLNNFLYYQPYLGSYSNRPSAVAIVLRITSQILMQHDKKLYEQKKRCRAHSLYRTVRC